MINYSSLLFDNGHAWDHKEKGLFQYTHIQECFTCTCILLFNIVMFHVKRIVTMNTHVKYRCSSTHWSKIIINKVNIQFKNVGQTPRVKNAVSYGRIFSLIGLLMGNIKALALTVRWQNDRQDKNNMPLIFDFGGMKT